MPKIEFLAAMNPDEAKAAIAAFSCKYKKDWKQWSSSYQSSLPANGLVASKFGSILRKWQAARPRPMRRPRSDNAHPAPYLEDLLAETWPQLQELGSLTTRDIKTATPQQLRALLLLWKTFCNLTYEGHATCVGISKSVLLLTEGRIGPAFDSTVLHRLRVRKPTDGETWIEELCSISEDIKSFEARYNMRIESLVATEWAPVNVGRAYDMVAGPR